MNDRGFGVIEIVVGIVIVAVLAGAGYVLYQGMGNDDKSDTSTTPASQSTSSADMNNMEHHETAMADWQAFTSEKYGYSFEYPSDWQVEVDEDGNPSTPHVELLNSDGEKRLSLYDNAAMGCEEIPTGDEEETSVTVGEKEIVIAKDCNQTWGFLMADPAKGDATITMTLVDFLGTEDEETVRMVLKTMDGLSNVHRATSH